MSSELVADCSVCGAWYLDDERSPAAQRLLERVLDEELVLVVPELWWYESINLLRSATLRGRISPENARKALYFLEEIPLETVHARRIGHTQILDLAQRHGLSAYDATYLALAEIRGIELITADHHVLSLCSTYPWVRPPA